jgi:hypothetical protein
MIRDALEFLKQQATLANGPQPIVSRRDGLTYTYMLPSGEVIEVETGPQPRGHAVDRLDDLIAYAASLGNALGEDGDGPVIWHGRMKVVLICNDAERVDTVHLDLPFSRQFQLLLSFDADAMASQFEPADFIRLLRREFGCGEDVVGPFRRLDFRVLEEMEAETFQGRDRMGKGVMSEVRAAEDLPSEILVSVAVHDAPGERVLSTVGCAIDIDTRRGRIIFRPLPGELEKAIDVRQESIRARLFAGLGEDFRIYAGRP